SSSPRTESAMAASMPRAPRSPNARPEPGRVSSAVGRAPAAAVTATFGACRKDTAVELLAAVDERALTFAFVKDAPELVHAALGERRDGAGVRRAERDESLPDEHALAGPFL